MWMFLTRRFRRWVLLAIALPVARLVAHRLALAAEHRDPSTRTSRALHQVDSAVTALSRRSGHRVTRLCGICPLSGGEAGPHVIVGLGGLADAIRFTLSDGKVVCWRDFATRREAMAAGNAEDQPWK